MSNIVILEVFSNNDKTVLASEKQKLENGYVDILNAKGKFYFPLHVCGIPFFLKFILMAFKIMCKNSNSNSFGR